jgi:hypothetical protein
MFIYLFVRVRPIWESGSNTGNTVEHIGEVERQLEAQRYSGMIPSAQAGTEHELGNAVESLDATDGSEGQFLSHPTTVNAAVTGGIHYGQAVLTNLVEGVRDDDPSISALPGTRGRSFCPTLEAEVSIACEEQTSFQNGGDEEEHRANIPKGRPRNEEGDMILGMAATDVARMEGHVSGSSRPEQRSMLACDGKVNNCYNAGRDSRDLEYVRKGAQDRTQKTLEGPSEITKYNSQNKEWGSLEGRGYDQNSNGPRRDDNGTADNRRIVREGTSQTSGASIQRRITQEDEPINRVRHDETGERRAEDMGLQMEFRPNNPGEGRGTDSRTVEGHRVAVLEDVGTRRIKPQDGSHNSNRDTLIEGDRIKSEGEEDNEQCGCDASELGGRDDQDARDLKSGKVKIPNEFLPIKSASGSEGHLLTHPDEVAVTLAGDQQASVEVFTLSERVCGDDSSTVQDIK